jgi:hypothetical protein
MSRQSEWYNQQTLQRLDARIPSGCPLLVERAPVGFRVWVLDDKPEQVGRFQIVAAWIDGFVAAWERQI